MTHHSILTRLLLGFIVVPALHAEPAAGLWQERSRIMAGGMTVQNVEAEACHAGGRDAGATQVQTIAQRLIDGSCTVASASALDPSRYTVHCGGNAFGDGDAVFTETDEHALTINIRFRNEAAGGIETEYATTARWLRPLCDRGQ